MKFILCTGDSHTIGEGVTDWYGSMPPAPRPYNIKGDGLSYNRTAFGCNTYVNLVRDYVINNSDSYDEELFRVKDEFYKSVGDGMTFDCEKGDYIIFTLIATQEESEAVITADGKEIRRHTLVTHNPRNANAATFDICVNCEGAKKITITSGKGDVKLAVARLCGGEYAVVNGGVGACDSKQYRELNADELLREFSPWMVIAEGHTINDFLTGRSADEYKKNFGKLCDVLLECAEHLIVVVPSPIVRGEDRETLWPKTTAEYEEYITALYEFVEERGFEMADAHTQMAKEIEGLTNDEKHQVMFHDILHVNDHGHEIYANKIIEKIKDKI